MRFLIFLLLIPFWGFSQSHLFNYYDEVEVLKGGQPMKLPWAGGFNAAQVNMADLDGDSQGELIILDRNSASLKIFSFAEGDYIYRPDLLEYLLGEGLAARLCLDQRYAARGRSALRHYRVSSWNWKRRMLTTMIGTTASSSTTASAAPTPKSPVTKDSL